jgi:hypothetical protein
MDNLTCPNCGQPLMVMRSGTRAGGSGPGPWPEQPITTTASCNSEGGCGALWDRDYGDQGAWRASALA